MSLDNEVKFIWPKSPVKRWIEVMHYSPCGKYLAVGSHDSKLSVFLVKKNYKQIKFSTHGHSAAICCLDWSQDSTWIRTVDIAHELLFWKLDKNGKPSRDPSGASNTVKTMWANQTAKFGWCV